MQWTDILIYYASSAKNHFFAGEETQSMPTIRTITKLKMLDLNLFAQNAAIFQLITVQNMELILLILSVNSVALMPIGFFGALLIFVKNAIIECVKATM